MSDPAVSVVVATRDRRAMLAESVASVRAQDGVSWELVVVDDASTDDTWSYLQSLSEPRLRALRQERHGERSAARNRGLAEARGDLVMFLDDDDLLLPAALRRLAGALTATPRAVAAVGARWDWSFVHGGGRRDSHVRSRRERDIFFELLFGWSAVSGQNLYRAEVVRRLGGFDAGLHSCEDRDLWLRVARQGPVVLVPDTVMRYRVHPGQWRPDDIQDIRERVYRRAISGLEGADQRRGLSVRRSSRLVQDAERAIDEGRLGAGLVKAAQALAGAPRIFGSPLIGAWVARRLAVHLVHHARAALRQGRAQDRTAR